MSREGRKQILIILAVLLCLLAAAAVLISAGAVGEDSAFLVIAAACLIGCFVGGRFAVRRTAGRRSLVGFGSAAFFLVLLIVIGFLCMDGMKLSGEGLVFAPEDFVDFFTYELYI